jgi:hypothetical protein
MGSRGLEKRQAGNQAKAGAARPREGRKDGNLPSGAKDEGQGRVCVCACMCVCECGEDEDEDEGKGKERKGERRKAEEGLWMDVKSVCLSMYAGRGTLKSAQLPSSKSGSR